MTDEIKKHGGPRSGAGRKPGTVSKQTKDRRRAIHKASSEGIMPLDVMLGTMRSLWAQAHYGPVPNEELKLQAHAVAKDAAPYLHPKLSNIEANVAVTGHEAALDELE